MKKAEASLVGCLVVVGIIVYIFMQVHEKIGWLGIGFVGLAVISFGILWNNKKEQKEQKTFDDHVIYVLYSRIDPEVIKGYFTKYSSNKHDFPKWTILRDLQIIRESIDIALSTKKRDTAESRMGLILNKYKQIKSDGYKYISQDVLVEIGNRIQETKKEFNTKFYLNIATGYMEKAQKVKTKKSKEKYYDLAIETLKEGLEKGLGEDADLKGILVEVEEAKSNL